MSNLASALSDTCSATACGEPYPSRQLHPTTFGLSSLIASTVYTSPIRKTSFRGPDAAGPAAAAEIEATLPLEATEETALSFFAVPLDSVAASVSTCVSTDRNLDGLQLISLDDTVDELEVRRRQGCREARQRLATALRHDGVHLLDSQRKQRVGNDSASYFAFERVLLAGQMHVLV